MESNSSHDLVSRGPLRCGVIGLGRIGWDYHAKTILGDPRFQLAAVCDLDEKRTSEAHAASGCATYSSAADLVSDSQVELVVVASQSVDHEPMTLAALAAHKHVLCEKPAALGAGGMRRMAEAAERAGTVLTVHHNYRLSPEFLAIREIIESGLLGTVNRIKRRNVGFNRRNDWQVLKKYGGGMTGNWGIHLVDQCLCLLDSEVSDVWGDVKQIFNPGDAEDDIKAVIRGASGMTLDIDMSSANAAPEFPWIVAGSTGTLWVDGGKAHLQWFDPNELPPVQVNDGTQALGRKYGVVGEGSTEIPWQTRIDELVPKRQYPTFYDNLYAAIREGQPLLVTPASALATYEVLDEIRRGTRFAPAE